MIRKLLIANRGEIACRIIRSCRSLGIQSVAICSEIDSVAKHAQEADEVYPVGPSPAGESYLNANRILEVARECGADALHPGYGFLAENARFARAVEGAGLNWIGPCPDTIAVLGDKERARIVAQAAGVPILPGSERFRGELGTKLFEQAQRIGCPLLVKASAGGGGIGMRLVGSETELPPAVKATQEAAQKAFGDGTVYLERYVRAARHVEVQVFGFGDGRAVHFFERDCSIQRRFQKIVEEGPAPRLSYECRHRMHAAALALTRAQNYRGVGTVEFLVNADTEEFYFLEMNTRIQVEHPVTEMITGWDLVALQLRFAGGDPKSVVSQDWIDLKGHAIECRIYAERPGKNFFPATGTLADFDFPDGLPDVRVDTGLRKGDSVSHYYDPLVAKIIVRGVDRDDAIKKMAEALAQFRITGLETNLDMLRRVVGHSAFQRHVPRTDFIETFRDELIKAA